MNNKLNKLFRFELKIANIIYLVFMLCLLIIGIVLNNNNTSWIVSFDTSLENSAIMLFGIPMNTFLEFLLLSVGVEIIKSMLRFLSGIIGRTMQIIFRILFYSFMLIPFGLFQIYTSLDFIQIDPVMDIHLDVAFAINVKILVITYIVYLILVYVFEMLEYWDFTIDRNIGDKVSNNMNDFNDIGEIEVKANKDKSKTYYPKFNDIYMPNLESDLIFRDNQYQEVDRIKEKILPPHVEKKIDEKDHSVIYEFSD